MEKEVCVPLTYYDGNEGSKQLIASQWACWRKVLAGKWFGRAADVEKPVVGPVLDRWLEEIKLNRRHPILLVVF